jgi:hypothetical protein
MARIDVWKGFLDPTETLAVASELTPYFAAPPEGPEFSQTLIMYSFLDLPKTKSVLDSLSSLGLACYPAIGLVAVPPGEVQLFHQDNSLFPKNGVLHLSGGAFDYSVPARSLSRAEADHTTATFDPGDVVFPRRSWHRARNNTDAVRYSITFSN